MLNLIRNQGNANRNQNIILHPQNWQNEVWVKMWRNGNSSAAGGSVDWSSGTPKTVARHPPG